MLTVPDRVREKIVETYRMHRRLERVKARETDSSGARPAVTPATPVFSRQYGQCGGNEGFVDSTVRPPRDGNNGKAVDHVATGTTRKAKIVKRD
ncbi:MAG: hypothetical protein NTY83_00125 [Candidatus Micrarchaeota archaeon]|nr:hypothetical protein [Candidatus Micrarchaeota archaeon]